MKAVGSAWDEKIDRAELLASQYEATAEILRFYVKVLRFQKDVQEQLNGPGADVAQLLPFVPKFLKLLKQSGTPQMCELAASSAGLDWAAELNSYWTDRSPRDYNPLAFVVTALLQPFARSLGGTHANRSQID